MRTKIFSIISVALLAFSLTACSSKAAPEISSYEEANKDWLSQVDEIISGDELAMQGKVQWGMSLEDLKKAVKGPYYEDTDYGVSVVTSSSLPSDETWKNEDETLNSAAFEDQDVKAYYFVDTALIEYGYLVYDASLHQYDFLKEYYTKKYGEPEKEEFIWNDESYKPTGKEDMYEMFAAGKVKVLTVWDIEELDTVLVVDWLNDPVDLDYNYGQISFYSRSEDFDVNSVSDTVL